MLVKKGPTTKSYRSLSVWRIRNERKDEADLRIIRAGHANYHTNETLSTTRVIMKGAAV